MTGRQQLARLLPLAALLLLAAAGLRGRAAAPGWDGPLKAHGVVIGLALEAILIVLLVVTLVRDSAARRAAESAPADVPDGVQADVPAALRWVLKWVLGIGVLAVAVVLLLNLNLHLFTGTPPRTPAAPARHPPAPHPRAPPTGTFRIPLEAIGYGLLVAALIAAVVAGVWWSSRLRAPAAAGLGDDLAEDSEELRDAVAEGRAALAGLDDARAAIIACYVAMERSLADRGTARGIADTPDELLARAAASGIIRGPGARAAETLTGLFYEARFSSHSLGPGQRDAARRSLDDLAAGLSEPAGLSTPVEPTP
ncbi:MAG: DUF4129 domain-containing protein [Nocardiopsaceae bacterium]|nr:DUF4129 domain-containing protein [Nocardiopsaceae bacterium]